jgi:hypothetical protein
MTEIITNPYVVAVGMPTIGFLFAAGMAWAFMISSRRKLLALKTHLPAPDQEDMTNFKDGVEHGLFVINRKLDELLAQQEVDQPAKTKARS